MANPKQSRETPGDLRRKAEARVGAPPAGQGADLRLVHELKVHQAELEMQNQELRESRQALEESLARYADLYEFAPVGYFTLDPAGTVTRVNLAGDTLLGMERAALLRRNLEHFLAADSRPAFRSFLEGLLLGHGDASCEAGLGPEDPPERFVSLAGAAEQDGRFCRVAMTDITGRGRADGALRQALDASRDASRAKSGSSPICATIRTPLNGIVGTLQLLETTSLDRDRKELIEMGLGSSRRLTQLLADILDLVRVEAGRLSIQSEPFNLRDTVASVGLLFNPAARRTGVELRLTVDPAIPPRLLGDSARLPQMFNNLVGNSMKFTTAGSVSLEAAALSTRCAGRNRILFSVADTGCGIPEDKLEYLFEPFTQASSGYARKFQGAGLGLSICKRLVGLMGGNIFVESEVGVGATVNVCIPFEPAETPVAGLREDGGKGVAIPTGLRVLLADDDPVSAFTMVRMLENEGCEAQAVEDGQQALDALRQGRFDLVLLDVQMPVMNGVETTRAIRRGEAGKGRAGIAIVALTAYAMSGDKEAFLEAGMSSYLAKPVDMDELARVLAGVGRKVTFPPPSIPANSPDFLS